MEQNQRQTREEFHASKRSARESVLIDATLRLASSGTPYHQLLRNDIAAAAGVSNGTINHAFETLDGLRAAAMREAVRRENLVIIAQGLAVGDPIARDAPPGLKERAIRAIV